MSGSSSKYEMFINGSWCAAEGGADIASINPAERGKMLRRLAKLIRPQSDTKGTMIDRSVEPIRPQFTTSSAGA